ncbi:hypothetical protein ACTXT7_000140 [Hymenolepis weldensis]
MDILTATDTLFVNLNFILVRALNNPIYFDLSNVFAPLRQSVFFSTYLILKKYVQSQNKVLSTTMAGILGNEVNAVYSVERAC